MKTINRCMNWRRERGLCAECGRVKSERFRCDDCRIRNNERCRASRAKNRREGRCVQCGGENDTVTIRCSCCNGKAVRAAKRRNIQRFEASLAAE